MREKFKEKFEKVKVFWLGLTGKQQISIIAVSLVVGILAWSFFSAKLLTMGLNRKDLVNSGDEQQAIVEGIILTETKDEAKYWEIYGEKGSYDSANEIATLNEVLANFYDENREVSMSIKSSKGTYDSQKEIITLYENTHVVLRDGISLKTDKLVWSGSDNPIKGYGHVIITKDDGLLATAEEIEISPDYDDIKITGNTVSKIFDDGSKNE